jgi:hypothetical protein
MNSSIKKAAFFAVAIIAIIQIAGCASTKNITIERMRFPPDFMKYKSNILIPLYDYKKLKGRDNDLKKSDDKRLNRMIPDAFAKYYTGAYTIVQTDKDIIDLPGRKFKVTNPAYADVDKYRYVFYSNVNSSISSTSNTGNMVYSDATWGIYDRKEDKIYLENYVNLNCKIYIQKMEEARAR